MHTQWTGLLVHAPCELGCWWKFSQVHYSEGWTSNGMDRMGINPSPVRCPCALPALPKGLGQPPFELSVALT